MKNPVSLVVLVVALAAPIALFLVLSAEDVNGYVAAGLSVSAGWLLNFAWALSAFDHRSESRRTVSIAVRYGWACPAVLVIAVAIAQRLADWPVG
ncbi:hypothetical protein DWG18_11395 [Lysobacter sp. TY2-98]|uniref:hypothetical protein n=1 Tax=Lysobacter sp. TY2-98 TaxID=2290922 RepID=UPI000E20C3BD|nr:hypothetical protein [Lysobacter sp. TY2-98]AXK72823.1 hypothetical protein DWG18_11395 [Lysobacter sp. TY2-98]